MGEPAGTVGRLYLTTPGEIRDVPVGRPHATRREGDCAVASSDQSGLFESVLHLTQRQMIVSYVIADTMVRKS